MPVDAHVQAGVAAVADAAGRAIMDVYAGAFSVSRKDDCSPVTAADLAAHRVIVEGLRALTPQIPVLSEESAHEVADAERLGWPRLWLVDPLDGTREFVKRNGEFVVCIALVEAGVATWGLIQRPLDGGLWWGGAGYGAWTRQAGQTRALSVGQVPADRLRVAASRSHGNARTDAMIARMGPVEHVWMGSALKFCWLADGRLDVYARLGPTSEWDTAAGQAIVEGAGGALLDLSGRPFRYNVRPQLTNGAFVALADPQLPWHDWCDPVAG